MKSCSKTRQLKKIAEKIESVNIGISLALKTAQVLEDCYDFNAYAKKLCKITILHLCKVFEYPVPNQLSAELDVKTALQIVSALAAEGAQIKDNLESLHKKLCIKIAICLANP